MHTVHVAVGSNIDPARHVPAGLARLHEVMSLSAASPFYRTPAIGRPGQPGDRTPGIGRPGQQDYWNGIVVARTPRTKEEVTALLREVEAATGRVRGPDRYAPRTLDLDILLWDRHPPDAATRVELLQRPFLLRCLLDLEPLITLAGQPLRSLLPPDTRFARVDVALPF